MKFLLLLFPRESALFLFFPMNSTFFAIFQIAENARFLELEVVKPVILCFLHNKKRGKWPFLNMVMRGLFFRKKKFFSEKRGFWPNFTVIVRGLFEIKILYPGPALYVKQFLLIFFRGKRPFFRLYMRGHFLDWYFFEEIPGVFADFQTVYEGTF